MFLTTAAHSLYLCFQSGPDHVLVTPRVATFIMPRLGDSQGAKSVAATDTDQAEESLAGDETLAEAAVEETRDTPSSPRKDAATDPYEKSGQ